MLSTFSLCQNKDVRDETMRKGQKKRIWTPEQKPDILNKHTDEHLSVRALEKAYGAEHSMICRWVKHSMAGSGKNCISISAWSPLKMFRSSRMSMCITSITDGLRPLWTSNAMVFCVYVCVTDRKRIIKRSKIPTEILLLFVLCFANYVTIIAAEMSYLLLSFARQSLQTLWR